MNKLVEALEKIALGSDTSLNSGKSISQIHKIAQNALEEHEANKDGWVSMKTRKPTINDANAGGFVVVLYNGYPQVKHWEVAASFKTVLWCSLPSLPTTPPTNK